VAVYSIKTQRVTESSKQGFQWHLDYPTKDQKIDITELSDQGLLFQGWVLNDKKSSIALVLLNGGDVLKLQLTRSRPDVISKVLGQEADDHPQLQCGFSQYIKLKHSSFSLGIVQGGRFSEILTGSIDGKFQVLRGKENWLFLDNDTNKSVEQHTGKLKLSRTAQYQWKDYLVSLNDYSTEKRIPVCLLVAPSKEMVCDEYYPHVLSKKAPIQSFLKLVPKTLDFLFPVEELKTLEKRSFRVCDTHWTFHGARLASQLLACKLSGEGIDTKEVFKNDIYQERNVTGDLGSKIFPPHSHNEERLVNFNYRKKVVFDNNIANFGRVIVMNNDEATTSETLLIFGSSSSYTMFHYICRIYSSVVFVHTAGNIDHEVIKKVEPDCICLQTNARFIIKAPRFEDSIGEYINLKKQNGELSEAFVAKSIAEESLAYIDYFKQLLR
jgi:alginate O-acetyltransferase complex protein AlgJ